MEWTFGWRIVRRGGRGQTRGGAGRAMVRACACTQASSWNIAEVVDLWSTGSLGGEKCGASCVGPRCNGPMAPGRHHPAAALPDRACQGDPAAGPLDVAKARSHGDGPVWHRSIDDPQ
jgi:hypothetical protein